MLAEVGGDGRIPGGSERAPEAAALAEKPAKRRNRAHVCVGQRCHHVRQPIPPGPSVRIGKHENVKSPAGLQYGCAEVVHFFAASFGTPGDDDVNPALAGCREPLDNLARRVFPLAMAKKIS